MKDMFGIDKSWFDAGLDIDKINEIMNIISKKREFVEILPKHDDIFNSIKYCPLDNVKVLIIGQDPYPSSEHAHGLAFSSLSSKTPASLKNIFKKLELDFPNSKHISNNLTSWVKQGVLLLNTSLTFEGKDVKLLKEHTKLWQPIINQIYEILIKRGNVIVMRWGAHAQKSGEIFNDKSTITVMDTTHPSPFSARNGFFSCNHFTECNKILGSESIDWNT